MRGSPARAPRLPLPRGGRRSRSPILKDVKPGTVIAEEWKEEYEGCPRWGPVWRQTRSAVWPKGYRVADGKLYHENRLCVPVALAGQLIREHHSAAGHPGGARLWYQMGRFYEFGDSQGAERLARWVQQGCEVCQV